MESNSWRIKFEGRLSIIDGHVATVDSIFATLLGFKEFNIFGEVIKILKIDIKCVTGKSVDNAGDEPRTDTSESTLLIGITLNIREVITGLKMVTSTEVGIVFTRKGEELSNVSNRPSRKPKWVDGGNFNINSVCVLEAMNDNNDSRVCKGRQLTEDFDIDSAVIKFIVDECGNSLKKSVEDTIPSIETKVDFGMLFRIPGDSDSNPFKNRSLSFGGTW